MSGTLLDGYVPVAPDSGLLLANFDPIRAQAATVIKPAAGFIYLMLAYLNDVTGHRVVNNMYTVVSTAGATLTLNQCRAGIYDLDGNLKAQTVDQSVAWTSIGQKQMALTAGVDLNNGPYWLAHLANGTTTPTLYGAGGVIRPAIGKGFPNYVASIPGAHHRAGFETAGGRTSLINLAGLNLSDANFALIPWYGAN